MGFKINFKGVWNKISNKFGKPGAKPAAAKPESAGKLPADQNKIDRSASAAAARAADKYAGPEFANHTFERPVYPWDKPRLTRTTQEFMDKFVSKDVVGRYEIGGWSRPDDAQMILKFFDIKDRKTFYERVLPDLNRWMAERGF